MALDKLVNSTVLDAALRYTANRIRAKTGGSENLPFDMSEENPKGFGDAVDDISGGGGITPTGTKEITITENGTTTEDVTNYASAQIIVNVSSGGGGQSETAVNLPSVAEETTLKDYLAAHPIPLKYVNEILWVWFYCDSAPSSGGVTKWNQFWVEGDSKIMLLSAYSNNNVSANSLGIGGSAVGSTGGSYYNIANGAITNSGMTNTSRKIAAGTTVKALHIPINYNTFSLESTLR